MKQAIMNQPGTITFRDVEIPDLGPDQIMVKIMRIGICGSDVHVNHGRHPYTSYPVVQGHEVSAVVVEVGGNVQGFAVGDTVTIQPQVVCGECYPCTHGMYNDCEKLKVMGFQTTGMASEYFVVDALKALKLPDGISYDHGAMIEPLAVAVHAVRRFGDVAGKRALVLGGGPIGNLVAQTLVAEGAETVALSELSDFRRGIAKDCGIITIDSKQQDIGEAIHSCFGTDGADVIFDCVGVNATMEQAIRCARKGSDIVVVGVFADLGQINMGFVQDHELRLIGTAMYRVEDYREAIRLASEKRVNLDALITDHVPFLQYADAYKLIDEHKDRAMKVIIDME